MHLCRCRVAACRDARADIAFVLDASGSIIYKSGANSTANYTNWNLMKAFVITLIRSLSVSANQTRIALVRFSHEASIVFQLDSYSTAQQAIEVTDRLASPSPCVFSSPAFFIPAFFTVPHFPFPLSQRPRISFRRILQWPSG